MKGWGLLGALVIGIVLISGGEREGEELNAAEVFLEASRPDFQPIPIWILGFGDGHAKPTSGMGIGRQIAQILRNDLTRSQLFEVVNLPLDSLEFSQSHCMGEAPLSKARNGGVTVTTWGRVGRQSSDVGARLILEACAFDQGEDGVSLGKRYVGMPISMRMLRTMVHRWADQLAFYYTGESGIAQTQIAYVAEEGKGQRNVYVMDYDGYGPRRLTAGRRLNLMPAWSPDKKALAYTAYRENQQEIVQLAVASGKKTRLVPPSNLNITPAFSPDGRFLAYASAAGGNTDLYLLDLKTGDRQQLTFHASADLSPTWSPNGREIAFTSDRGGKPQIYIMSADGSNVRRLTFEGEYNAAPAWSPRGDWIAYVCQIKGQGFRLCRITPDGQQRVQITSGRQEEMDDSPSWSPDGRHLVFSSTRGGRSHIYFIHADGTGLERLTSGGRHYSSPAWSPRP
ncbi:MAG: Tol-Pal system beta propeller repeat protein TolB [Nitrospirae bacterium]|nr:MAG: Tol-Pal system beta propeller repeat protein TolB [Nitrospirota bacterium]